MADRPLMQPGRGARPRILAAARELFTAHGINVTGVAELCAAAHVSKRTLYQHFPGKDDVVVAYLSDWEDDPDDGPDALLARAELAPRTRLLELFDLLGEPPYRGDPFANAAVECADRSHPAHRYATAHGERFVSRLAEVAREAGARDAERVGRRIGLLYHGAAVDTVLSGDAHAADEARALAARVLSDAVD